MIDPFIAFLATLGMIVLVVGFIAGLIYLTYKFSQIDLNDQFGDYLDEELDRVYKKLKMKRKEFD